MTKQMRTWINAQVRGYQRSLREHDVPAPELIESALEDAYSKGFGDGAIAALKRPKFYTKHLKPIAPPDGRKGRR